MQYPGCVTATFLARPNRFVAKIVLEGREETVHVKNTGRLRELLQPGVTVILAEGNNPARKTKYDLVAVQKSDGFVNIDSQAPNFVAAEWLPHSGLFSDKAVIRREVTFGASRFDLFVEDGDRKAFIEVKGVTLDQGGTARFPDAPTERGIKHIEELIRARETGFETYLLFVIQMKGVTAFAPNDDTHPGFGAALRKADAAGVKILAMDCVVTADSLAIDTPISVQL
ncbi:MAG: DNA/RNA nuclease SfsA [Clostridia bacterium]|nr:DNA/RNA nuclease SfsA [Clostridia bacterium]